MASGSGDAWDMVMLGYSLFPFRVSTVVFCLGYRNLETDRAVKDSIPKQFSWISFHHEFVVDRFRCSTYTILHLEKKVICLGLVDFEPDSNLIKQSM